MAVARRPAGMETIRRVFVAIVLLPGLRLQSHPMSERQTLRETLGVFRALASAPMLVPVIR
jgi:hypothetical protein